MNNKIHKKNLIKAIKHEAVGRVYLPTVYAII